MMLLLCAADPQGHRLERVGIMLERKRREAREAERGRGDDGAGEDDAATRERAVAMVKLAGRGRFAPGDDEIEAEIERLRAEPAAAGRM